MMLHRCYYFVIIHPADWIMGVKTQSPAKGQLVPKPQKLLKQVSLRLLFPDFSVYLGNVQVQRTGLQSGETNKGN